MVRFIQEHGATEVLCGGLGAGAVNMLKTVGIELHAGAPAIAVDDVVKHVAPGLSPLFQADPEIRIFEVADK